ncbi:PDDEXK nuclease domain-containing protein [Variovorax sp. J22P240]|uniref:PDDEXK nuclease domain-containing protein n=1 Tax=Variovorax sp. J22P240 TaxID=3053514 RepID=UPI0025756558|nr:PDDEXK nuclease domain-containing protein [Variovorax sp. J22P240]MDM0002550.1 PDDEXK nuclease domain-containing protein [Variovorax sp. J22P240]
MTRTPDPTSDYAHFIDDLKRRVAAARLSAARAVNRDLIALYWDIGKAILDKQQALGWGQAVVEQIARDLRASFPGTQGFSARNVWDMRRLYEAYAGTPFLRQLVAESPGTPPRRAGRSAVAAGVEPGLGLLRQLVAEVPWGHHLVVLGKVTEPAERLFYLRAVAAFGWSRNVLLNQIKARAYERSLSEGKSHNFPVALPGHLAEQAEEALKSSYNLEFLGIRQAVKERDLENQLIDKLRDFILELGYGFCFIGRQHRLTLGRNEYFIDLLFYHRFLKSLVAIELKIGKFEPEYAGKMDFYLNLLNDKERAPDDAPSIGIILCAEKDNLEVEFALKSKSNPIGVAEYQLQGKLPAEMKGKLPSARQLQEVVRAALPRPGPAGGR